jgi:hypothetical protein
MTNEQRTIIIRLSPELHETLKDRAASRGLSLNKFALEGLTYLVSPSSASTSPVSRGEFEQLEKQVSDLLRHVKELEKKLRSVEKPIPDIKKPMGINQTDLCIQHGISSSNVARKAKESGKTSQQLLEEYTGFKYNFIDRKYYPPDSNVIKSNG